MCIPFSTNLTTVPSGCTILTGMPIDDPIAYMSKFSKLYEKIAAFRDFVEKRSTAYFTEIARFAVWEKKLKMGLDESHFYHFELFAVLYLCFSLFWSRFRKNECFSLSMNSKTITELS